MLLRQSPPAALVKMPIRVADLAFHLRVLYYRSLFSQNSLTTKKTGKEGVSLVKAMSFVMYIVNLPHPFVSWCVPNQPQPGFP